MNRLTVETEMSTSESESLDYIIALRNHYIERIIIAYAKLMVGFIY